MKKYLGLNLTIDGNKTIIEKVLKLRQLSKTSITQCQHFREGEWEKENKYSFCMTGPHASKFGHQSCTRFAVFALELNLLGKLRFFFYLICSMYRRFYSWYWYLENRATSGTRVFRGFFYTIFGLEETGLIYYILILGGNTFFFLKN